jgi:hypothetical protein
MTGTRNGASKRDRSTYARGERTRHAKLDAGQVIEIRRLVRLRIVVRTRILKMSFTSSLALTCG